MTTEELYYLPGSELIKHIQAEKDRLIKEKIIKKQKELPPITEAEKPYKLPTGWEWVRLVDVSSNITDGTHKTPTYVDFGVHFLSIKDLTDNSINFKGTRFISEEEHNELIKRAKVDRGDILFSRIGTLDRIVVVDTDKEFSIFVSLGLIKLLQKFVHPKYIRYCMHSTYFRQYVEKVKVIGSHASKFNLGDVRLAPIPLPPLYIQDQIVQKLEQLSKTKDGLLVHAESQSSYTKKMREALLQEAIRGELVPQDENDEPVSVLLEKIKIEKERLIKEKVIKKPKVLPPITEDEKPYDLPVGWEWIRLGDVCTKVTDGSHNPPKSKGEGIPMISAKNIVNGTIDLKLSDRYVNDIEFAKEDARTQIRKDDVLISIVGTIGRTAIVPTNEKLTAQRSVGILKTLIFNRYLKYTLDAPMLQSSLIKQSAGTAQRGIYLETLRNVLIPLPPLAEQQRIVAKLDELMANCNELEVKAEEMTTYTIKLFEAILKETFMSE